MHAAPKSERHRPKTLTVFAAAFVAGAAAAVGINRALDVHLAQKKPQVQSEPIFVALRSLPQGSPVTVWDVALRDWPVAMMPGSAMRAEDSFEGCVLRHPLREGQPLLSVQLVRDGGQRAATDAGLVDTTFTAPAPASRPVEADLWSPAPAVPLTTTSQPQTERTLTIARPTGADPSVATSADVAPPTAPAAAPPTPAEVAAVTGEPTLAAPPRDEPTPADTPPPADAGVESVVAAKSVTAPGSGAPAPSAGPRSRDGTVRYLVVPERIALQADAGFAGPPPATSPAAVQGPPATPPDGTRVPPVRQAPNRSRSTTAGPRSVQQVPPTRRPQAVRPSRQPAVQTPRQPQRRQPTAPTAQQAAPESPRGLAGLFPNLAAGIDAMTGRQDRAADENYDEAVATDDPNYRPRR